MSKINNVVVRFQAGEEVILENGFDSGNNFIAEIVPCVPTVTIISSKPESDEFVAEHFKSFNTENNSNFFESDNAKINAFPTVLVDSKITIEITGIENVSCLLVNNQGKVLMAKDFRGNVNGFTEYIDLPNIASGMYFLVVKNENNSETIKIIKP